MLVSEADMVDICMCNNDECPLKKHCYRYMAEASQYQTYFIVDEKLKKDAQEHKCTGYWDVKSKADIERLNRYWYEP